MSMKKLKSGILFSKMQQIFRRYNYKLDEEAK